jgi:TatD DNase family protein
VIIDTHCHLHDPVFSDVRAAVASARRYDVWGIVAVGCDPASNELTLAAAATEPKAIWPCLGFHPEWPQLTDDDLDRVERQLHEHHARIVAVGEVGLPWYSLPDTGARDGRMARGRQHLDRLARLAVRYDLAVAVHAPHGAAAAALDILRRNGVERAVFHWHKAPADVTAAIVAAGYLVSVTPEVVYRERDREMVATVPIEALLVESDAPWAYRGEFEGVPPGPWLVGRVVEEVAKIKAAPVDDVRSRLSTNACRLFHLAWV